MLKIKSERELNIIRGKLAANHATFKDIQEFLKYVMMLESLVKEASNEDFYGSEGYRHQLGWDN